MARVLFTFLGRPFYDKSAAAAGGPPRYQQTRYRFGASRVSRPASIFGLALLEDIKTQGWQPDEVIVFGTSGSQWDALYELLGEEDDESILAGLELGEAVQRQEVSRRQLDEVEETLSKYLGGQSVRCTLLSEANDEESQLAVMQTFGKYLRRGDEVYLDVTHGFRHWGLVGLESLFFLRQVRQIKIKGVYYANLAAKDAEGVVPAVRLDAADKLADWSEALASFRQTGQLGRLPELFEENHRDIAVPLRELRFALMANRFGKAAHGAQQSRGGLKRLVEEEKTTLASFFARTLLEEFELFNAPHIADWQLKLARRSLESGDYLRASINAYEAIISAAIKEPTKRQQGRERQKVTEELKAKGWEQGLDRAQFRKLSYLRNALAHGGNPSNRDVEQALRSEEKLRAFLEPLVDFAERAVAELKGLSGAL